MLQPQTIRHSMHGATSAPGIGVPFVEVRSYSPETRVKSTAAGSCRTSLNGGASSIKTPGKVSACSGLVLVVCSTGDVLKYIVPAAGLRPLHSLNGVPAVASATAGKIVVSHRLRFSPTPERWTHTVPEKGFASAHTSATACGASNIGTALVLKSGTKRAEA